MTDLPAGDTNLSQFVKNQPILVASLFFFIGLLLGFGPDLILLKYLDSPTELLFWSSVTSLVVLALFVVALYVTLTQLQELTFNYQANLENQNQRIRRILSNIPGVVFRCRLDNKWTMLYLTDGVKELTGYGESDLIYNRNQAFADIIDEDSNDEIRATVEEAVEGETSYTLEYQIHTRSGERKWIWEQGRPITDPRTDEVILEGFLMDITERKHAEQTAESARNEALYQARHDSLTGLSSREWFLEEVESMIDDRGAEGLAFCIVDLDNFKQVNDFYGHWVGNSLLRQVGNWLTESTRSDTDLLGRLGGDEFGLVFPCSSELDPEEQIRERLDSFDQEFFVQGLKIHRSVTVGVAMYPDHGDDLQELMAAANRAVNRGKSNTTKRIARFREEDRQHLSERISSAESIMEAFHDNRLEVQYQPIVDVRTGEPFFQEALLRIRGEDGDKMTLSNFWQIIHQGRVTGRLDRWIVETVLDQTEDLIGEPPFNRVAVNLFPPTVVDQGYYEDLEEMLAERDFPRGQLILEISEQLLQDERRRASQMVEKISAEKNFLFALDDFGIGHGSFQSLKTLPLTCLKIDGSFIDNLPSSQLDRNFVRTISTLCNDLEIPVVGEWIENEETADILQDLGVTYQQGFHHARPAPIENFQND